MEPRMITRDELQTALENRENIKLVMAQSDWAYANAHIPGSLHFATLDEGLQHLDSQDDIIVYCSGAACPLSRATARLLVRHRYRRVRHYAGGLQDWADAGLPLEGALVA
jgi:rhodanese-related sulfurtransferase